LSPTASTDLQYSAAKTNLVNIYGAFSASNPINNLNQWCFGYVSGIFMWSDSYVNQIWLNANMQLALMTLLRQAGQLPYNNTGYNRIKTALQPILNQAINFGAITQGVVPSASQIAQMQATLGVNPAGALTNQGYYLQVADPGAVARQNRQSPVCTLYYMDGESIQQINLFSADVL